MFAPFIWMFKVENFKKHFWYLFFTYFKFFIPSLIIYFILMRFLPQYNITIFGYDIYTIALAIIGLVFPALCISGYFWEMTFSIINRDSDIVASSIYDGKIKVVNKITLPEINTPKFIWRGFASFVATVIMFLPFIIFVTVSTFLGVTILYQIAFTFTPVYLLLYIMLLFIVPGLLWNYAKQNSVVSTLNIFKAVYIAGNYPGRYIWNTTVYTVTTIFYSVLYYGLIYLMTILPFASDSQVFFVIKSFIVGFVFYFVNIYILFVYSYLLGTLAPEAEA